MTLEPASPQDMIRRLKAKGLDPESIAKALGGRVSPRTIYRWLKGEHLPQNKSDLQALRELLEKELTEN